MIVCCALSAYGCFQSTMSECLWWHSWVRQCSSQRRCLGRLKYLLSGPLQKKKLLNLWSYIYARCFKIYVYYGRLSKASWHMDYLTCIIYLRWEHLLFTPINVGNVLASCTACTTDLLKLLLLPNWDFCALISVFQSIPAASHHLPWITILFSAQSWALLDSTHEHIFQCLLGKQI